MAVSHVHLEWMMACYRMLRHFFRGRTDLYIASDLLVYYEQGNREAVVAPDVFVSFRVPWRLRPSYRVWLEGKPPDLVWEFGSTSAVKEDAESKKEKYRQMGVQEYWLVDPVGGYHEPRLLGFELVDGEYKELPWEKGTDGMVAAWSPLLGLEQRIVDGRQRFWNRNTRQYLELPEVEQERGRLEAEARAESAEQALESEKRARKALEARLAEIEAD